LLAVANVNTAVDMQFICNVNVMANSILGHCHVWRHKAQNNFAR